MEKARPRELKRHHAPAPNEKQFVRIGRVWPVARHNISFPKYYMFFLLAIQASLSVHCPIPLSSFTFTIYCL